MAEFHVVMKRNIIDPRVRASVLAKIYTEILRWAPHVEDKTESVDEDLCLDEDAGSTNTMPVQEADDG